VGELYNPDDDVAEPRRRNRSEHAYTGHQAVALRDVEWVVAKWGNKHRGRRKGGKGGLKAREVATAATAGVWAPTRLPEHTAENFAVEIVANAVAMVAMVREEDREETEVEDRIRMWAHTAWLLAGATGPEPPCWTSPKERAHYERLWHRVPTSLTFDDDWDGGAERGVMFSVAGADDDAYAVDDGAP
jgi:hypothetical protein